jgi:hypothetical protein
MKLRDLLGPEDLPAPDAIVPGVMLPLALAIVGTLLSCVVYAQVGWIVVGILFSVIAAIVPDYLLGWGLILFLAIGELSRPGTLRWQLFVLLAGVHLLHVLSLLAHELPWRTWMQPAVLRRPVLRFIAIQIPSQLVALVALELLAPDRHGHRPVSVAEFGVLGAVALGGLALLLFPGARDRPESR